MANRAMSRVTGVSGKVMEVLLEGRGLGLSIRDACARACVSETYFFAHQRAGLADIAAGHEGTSDAQFVQRLAEKEAQRLADALTLVRGAARGGEETVEVTTVTDHSGKTTTTTRTRRSAPQWQAAAWLLERTRPGEFSLMARAEPEEVSGTPATNGQGDLGITVEEARAAGSAIMRLRRESATLSAAPPRAPGEEDDPWDRLHGLHRPS